MTRATDGNGQEKDGGNKRLERLTSPCGDTFLPADECMPGCGRSERGCKALECDYFDRVITRLGAYEDTGIAPEEVKCLLRREVAARPVRNRRVAVVGTTWREAFACPLCGGSVTEDAGFCHRCGKRLKWEG